MNIINISKEERVLLNKCILKIIGENENIKRLSDSELMNIVLKEYIKEENQDGDSRTSRTAKK